MVSHMTPACRCGAELSPEALNALLLAVASVLERFIARIFKIKRDAQTYREATLRHDPVCSFKKLIV